MSKITLRLLIVLLFLVRASVVSAQEGPMLTVILLDQADAGVSGALITVRSEDGQTDFAQAHTDTAGRATIDMPLPAVVRVAVSGTLANATPLRQIGQDERGIWLRIDGQPTQLDLRVEPTGEVIPDPVTMISPELGVDGLPGAGVIAPPGDTAVPLQTSPVQQPTAAIAQPTRSSKAGIPVRLITASGLALLGAALLLVAFGKRGAP